MLARLLIVIPLVFLSQLLVFSSVATAEEDPVFSSWGKAIRGYDPVAYFTQKRPVKGSNDFFHQWNGAKWYFSTAAHKQLFVDNARKYAPQYGGYCAYGVAQGHAVSTQPEAWTIHEGKLYLNYNLKISSDWRKDIPAYLRQAELHWPSILK